MTEYRIGQLNGDGIGPEVVPTARDLLDAAASNVGVRIDWVELPMGLEAITRSGEPMSLSTIEALKTCDSWILGPHDSVAYPAEHQQGNPSGVLRTTFGLYANIRPAKAMAGVPAYRDDLDVVVVRENTEGFYADRNMHWGIGEFMPTHDVAMSVSVFTRSAIVRIIRHAFELSCTRRRRLAVVHKANILPKTTGMLIEVAGELAGEFPQVQVSEFHIDAVTAHLLRHPERFDVLVTENMFGDILSDMLGELAGGLGMAPSINASDSRAMAQAVHGAAPDIAGRGTANPVGIMLSTVMLARWLGARRDDPRLLVAADAMDAAIGGAIRSGVRTVDMGGAATTREFADAVISELQDESVIQRA